MGRVHAIRYGALGASASCLLLAFACGRLEAAGESDAATSGDSALPASPSEGGTAQDSSAELDARADANACGQRGSVSLIRFDLFASGLLRRGPQLAVSDSIAVTDPGYSGRCPIRGGAPVVSRLEPPWQTYCSRDNTRPSAVASVDGGQVVAGPTLGNRLDFLRVRWSDAGDPNFNDAGTVVSWDYAQFSVRAQTPRALALRGTRMLVGGAYETNEAYVAAFDPDAVEANRPDIALVQHDEPRLASVDGLSLRADGRFWASGRTPAGQLAVMRFGANDLPDATFGDAGLFVVEGTADVRATKVAATPEGGALVAAVDANGGMTVRRFTAAGALDATYGAAGVLASPFPAGGHVEPGRAQIALEPLTGAARFAGVLADPAPSGALRIRMTRILPNGVADPAFGASGLADTDVALANGAPWPPGEPYLLFDGSEDLGACQGKLAFALYRLTQRSDSAAFDGPGVAGFVEP